MLATNQSPFNFSRRWPTRLLCGAASAVWLTGGAFAATNADAATAPADTADSTLSEVTVTAQKREESLQRVALSATVRTGAELKAENVNTVQGLQYQVPGLSIQPPSNIDTYINIRGVGIQYSSPVASNGVAFYVDGLYIPSLIDTVDSFYDLRNVEVLRGPQGTLVGSNADGGAIFVNSAQPGFEEIGGYIEETYGNYNEHRTEGALNLPISEQFAARVAFVYETRDSFTRNIGPQAGSSVPQVATGSQNQPGNVDYSAVRLQLAFRPNDSFQYTFRYEPYESRTDGIASKPDEAAVAPLAAYEHLPAGQNYYDPWAAAHQNNAFLIDYQTPQYVDISGRRVSGTGVWHVTGTVDLKSVTGYLSGYESDLNDTLKNSAPGNTTLANKATAGNIYLTRTDSFQDISQEFDLLSTGPGAFQWVTGAYFLHTRNPLVTQFVNAPTGGPFSTVADHTNEAVFASGTYAFTPQWSLTLGGRYSHDSLPSHETSFPGSPVLTVTDSKPTGTVKVNFQATPQTLVYLSYATGYKAGGENLALPPIVPAAPYKPETNAVEELGLKTTFFDNHLRFDGDIFDSQYKEFQIQEAINSAIGSLPFVQGVPHSVIYGAEGEFTGQFDALQFDFGTAYLNAKTSGDFPYVTPILTQATLPSGTAIPFAPSWSFTGGIQYGIPVWGGTLTPRLQYQYQSVQYAAVTHGLGGANAALALGTTIPAHGTLDFNLIYKAAEHWSLTGYVTNLTDRAYISNALQPNNLGIPPAFTYGPPRQYGLRVNYSF
jgi:iron complex outermembrane receptor protein